uniref:Tetratricopeptide repeat domain 4 n=1 Tax=Sphenodon punctatus TaxID=8508 RepID=A0A8D0HAD7_SPHPU
NYEKAVISYSEGLKKKCNDADLNAVLCTNRAVAQFYLGNGLCSELEFVFGLNPGLLFFTGALCHLELGHFPEAIVWCEEGLRIDSKEKKLLETRNKADRLKRAEQRDSRKAKLVERKEQSQKEALLKALKGRNIQLSLEPSKEEDEVSDGLAELSLDGFGSCSAYGAKVCLDENGHLTWPVLFLYPEYGQTDFIAAFHEESRFMDHLMVMFSELPPWDLERKYHPGDLELYFEDEEREGTYQVNPEATLLQALQHQRTRFVLGLFFQNYLSTDNKPME